MDDLTHLDFNLADRFDRQHVLGVFLEALRTLAIKPNAGQTRKGV